MINIILVGTQGSKKKLDFQEGGVGIFGFADLPNFCFGFGVLCGLWVFSNLALGF